MQVSVEAGEGLIRKMMVEVPSESIDSEVENRLKSLRSRVKVDGFRPGKVPIKLVKQRYGEQVLHEVAAEQMQKSFHEAVTQEKLKLAGDPVISDQVIKAGEPLKYTAEFEVYPEIAVASVADLKLEKIASEVADADVDEMLETLRNQQTAWNAVERESANDDRITIDFVGKIDGEAFEGGTANAVPLVLGSGSMIPGFEEQLLGQKSGDEVTIEVPFPDDYQAAHLAGKMASFEVKVTAVEESALPELDDEFAKLFGVEEGGLDKLKSDVRNNLEKELGNRVQASLKNSVMEQLIEHNEFDAPNAVIEQEMNSLMQNAAQTGLDTSNPDLLRAEATRRVKLGILLGELVKQAELKPTREMVNARIETMAQDYEQPAEFVKHYQGNPQLMQGVESLVVEDMIVDWIAEQATVTTVDKSFNDLMNPGK